MKRAPLVIIDGRGSLAAVAWTNEKAAAKSVERGEVWYCHAGTGRVLPWGSGGVAFTDHLFHDSREGGPWYEVRLTEAAAGAVAGAATAAGAAPGTDSANGATPTQDLSATEGTAPRAAPASGTETARGPAAARDAETAPAMDRPAPDQPPPSGESLPSGDEVSRAGEILGALQGTIRRRRREMPEGSYTTHLFTEGAEKIRKKAGEEAIELLLARNADELAAEAADFIYHLMVLLEVEGESIGSVLKALRDRS